MPALTSLDTHVASIAGNVAAENPHVRFDFITPIIGIFLPMLLDWLKGCGVAPAEAGSVLTRASDGKGNYDVWLMVGCRHRGRQACRRAQRRELVGDRDFIDSLVMCSLAEAQAAKPEELTAAASQMES